MRPTTHDRRRQRKLAPSSRLILKQHHLPRQEHPHPLSLITRSPCIADMHRAMVFHMAGLTKHGELGMGVLRIMVEVCCCQPNSIEALVDFAPALFALLGTTGLTSPSCLLFAGIRTFIPV